MIRNISLYIKQSKQKLKYTSINFGSPLSYFDSESGPKKIGRSKTDVERQKKSLTNRIL